MPLSRESNFELGRTAASPRQPVHETADTLTSDAHLICSLNIAYGDVAYDDVQGLNLMNEG